MAHEKLSPRQKMIGMMYLVLTAMLALNVSKDAVEAFKLIDNGLTLSIKNYAQKNNLIYQDFEASFAQFPEKTGPYRNKALEVKQRADELFEYLQGLKIEIIKTAEGEDTPAIEGNEVIIDKVKKIDENNVPSQILIGSNDDQKAFALRTAIDDYRDFLISTLQGGNIIAEEALKKSLSTADGRNHRTGEMEKWPNYNFQALPLVYVITMLSKIQLDVRNAETEVINFLFAQIDKSNFKFNKLDAVVIPISSNYVTLGNNFEARVFISATDSTQQPVITVGNQSLDLDETGKGIYIAKATSIGSKPWGGIISLKAPDGSTKEYEFKSEYSVGAPNVVVSATGMNVLYTGIDNPIDISVPGVGPDKIKISRITNGTVTTGRVQGPTGEYFRGNWIVKPTSWQQKVQIYVTADMSGKPQNFEPIEFRVKPLPTPIGIVAGKSSGTIPQATLNNAVGVFANLPEFDFPLIYEVTGFTIVTNIRGENQILKSNGSAFTPEQKAMIARITRGNDLNIKEITAVGPDKIIKNLPPIILTIN